MNSGFFKLFKFIFGLIGIFCLFLLFMVIALTSVPHFTGKHYTNNESPSSLFYVVLESFDPHLNQLQFQCFPWDDFKEDFQAAEGSNVYICREPDRCFGDPIVPDREYTAYLSVSEGSCSNISSDFKVQELNDFSQVVGLRWEQETFKVHNSYHVDDDTVIPLYLKKIMSAGIAVSIFLVMIIVLPLTIIFIRYCHKKYGKCISAGFVFILLGLGALNSALFDRGLSLDPLTENPASFIFQMKILLIVSGILFVCAAISFWVHSKRRLKISD